MDIKNNINKAHWVIQSEYCEKFDNGSLTGIKLIKYTDINPYSTTSGQTFERRVESSDCPVNTTPIWVEYTPVDCDKCQRYKHIKNFNGSYFIREDKTGYKSVYYQNQNPNFPGNQNMSELVYDTTECPIDETPKWIYNKISGSTTVVEISYDVDDCNVKIPYSDFCIKMDVNPNSISYMEQEKYYLYCNSLLKLPSDAQLTDVFNL